MKNKIFTILLFNFFYFKIYQNNERIVLTTNNLNVKQVKLLSNKYGFNYLHSVILI